MAASASSPFWVLPAVLVGLTKLSIKATEFSIKGCPVALPSLLGQPWQLSKI